VQAGEILRSIFKDDLALVQEITKDEVDNAVSKIFCGWNFRKSAIDGLIQGREIGKYVYENAFLPYVWPWP
jgi:hypothetical protein